MNAIMKLKFCLVLVAINISAFAQKMTLSTSSDSAIFYYYEGWRQVMDEGNYTASELAYRKMAQFDPNFLVGLSLLGRITRDLNERLEIEKRLENLKGEVSGDEQLLLNNYIELVKLTNLRETNPGQTENQLKRAFELGERNLRNIVAKYPDDIYYKSEYIEVLHRNYGARAAIDSLYKVASDSQQQNSFMLGYAIHLHAELGEFKLAQEKLSKLQAQFQNRISPKPHAVAADLYFKMGRSKDAETAVDVALSIDPGNIDAQRLKKRISAQLEKN